MKLPSVEQVSASPAFPTAIWQLVPHQSGLLPVANGRGGPLDISWECHGEGPIKLILIGGLGLVKTDYQRQTLYFGHQHASRYTVLIADNRGMGSSGKPLMRYTTSDMARDLLEVVDHLGWTAERQLHVAGGSMGGMIAQELASLAPRRIGSLSLFCTGARFENTTTVAEYLANGFDVVRPKPLDRSIRDIARGVFPEDYLGGPDAAEVPDESTPRCRVPTGGYLRFDSNYARFAAQEIHKYHDGYSYKGFLMQAVAAAGHQKSAAQLEVLGDRVGRERILVLHGTADKMMPLPLGKKLIEYLKPGQGLIVDGLGHAPIDERTQWFNELLAERCRIGETLDRH